MESDDISTTMGWLPRRALFKAPRPRAEMQISPDIAGSRLVVLAGAGASEPLGKLTTRGFVEYLFSEIGTLQARDADASTFLRQLLEGVWGSNLDIEDVLATLENRTQSLDFLMADPEFQMSVLHNDLRTASAYRGRDLAARDFIYDEVIRHYGTIDAVAAAGLYRGLLGHFREWFDQVTVQPTLPFFTLNYDRSIEAATSELGIPCVDGIQDVRGKTERHWVRTALQEYREDPNRLTVVLVKLHGSVRLGRRAMAKYGLGDDELVELTGGLARDPDPYTHAVLYPTRNAKQLTEEPFYTQYRALNACLLRARLLLVIGCSLRDPDVQIAIRTACEDNPDLYILAIDPVLTHDDIALRLHVDPKRVACQQQEFTAETEAYLVRGNSPFMGMLRGYLASSLADASAVHSYPFGHTATPTSASRGQPTTT